MSRVSNTALFIAACIEESDKSNGQIALEVGFETAHEIAEIRDGVSDMPLAKLGAFSKAVGTDPVQLLTMCLNEYFPETWESVSPFLDTVLTADELSIVRALRLAVGGPYVMSLSADERRALNAFLNLLKTPHLIH